MNNGTDFRKSLPKGKRLGLAAATWSYFYFICYCFQYSMIHLKGSYVVVVFPFLSWNARGYGLVFSATLVSLRRGSVH